MGPATSFGLFTIENQTCHHHPWMLGCSVKIFFKCLSWKKKSHFGCSAGSTISGDGDGSSEVHGLVQQLIVSSFTLMGVNQFSLKAQKKTSIICQKWPVIPEFYDSSSLKLLNRVLVSSSHYQDNLIVHGCILQSYQLYDKNFKGFSPKDSLSLIVWCFVTPVKL